MLPDRIGTNARLAMLAGALALAPACVNARAQEAPPSGVVPASYLGPVAPAARSSRYESCDVPHPKSASGKMLHDYMVDGYGVRRCWYCDREPNNGG